MPLLQLGTPYLIRSPPAGGRGDMAFGTRAELLPVAAAHTLHAVSV